MDKYNFQKYVYFSRWTSYWYQINEVLELKPESLLVIGIGDKIVVDILGQEINEIKTLDIDEKLKPDAIGSVENLPFKDSQFDVILCAEVLEHLPFEKFEKCLQELRRVSKKYVVLSLPHFGPPIKFSFKIPLFKEVKVALKVPFPIKHKFNGEHYWEIGKWGYPASKIGKILKKYFKIKKEFIPFENQYHHFYILEKL
jgi:hypothetical protein